MNLGLKKIATATKYNSHQRWVSLNYKVFPALAWYIGPCILSLFKGKTLFKNNTEWWEKDVTRLKVKDLEFTAQQVVPCIIICGNLFERKPVVTYMILAVRFHSKYTEYFLAVLYSEIVIQIEDRLLPVGVSALGTCKHIQQVLSKSDTCILSVSRITKTSVNFISGPHRHQE